MSLTERLRKETGADEATAKYLLEACSDDYNMAVSMYADTAQPIQSNSLDGDAAVAAAATAAWAAEEGEDEVRAPIPRKFEVLCPDPHPLLLASLNRTSGSLAGAASSNVAHFRDLEHETRTQEALMGLGRSGVFGDRVRQPTPQEYALGLPGSSRSTNNSDWTAELEPDERKKLQKLEDLFKPPLDIIFKGSFFMAREEGKQRGQWLLVNVQDDQDFSCHRLNRDVWSNANVRKLLDGTFLLWQAGHDSAHGRKYMSFYPNVTFPYIAVIDSRTGEHMATFSETDPKAFCLFLKEFIKQHGRLPTNEQYDAQHDVVLAPEATAATAGASGSGSGADTASISTSSDSTFNGTSNTRRKRGQPCSSPSTSSSTSSPTADDQVNGADSIVPKRRRGMRQSDADDHPALPAGDSAAAAADAPHTTLLDITEEDQMKLAIAESLKTIESSSRAQADVDEDDDDDVLSEGAIEEFSDDEEINYSFEDKANDATTNTPAAAASSGGVGCAASSSSSNAAAGTPGTSASSEWQTAKGNLLSNGTTLSSQSPLVSAAAATSATPAAAAVACASEKAAGDSDLNSWRSLVEQFDRSDDTSLVLRLPDGAKETVTLPRAAPLQVVLAFLAPRGYSPVGYRAFAGWPKKDLFLLPSSTTLKEAGLLPRDTIILQQD